MLPHLFIFFNQVSDEIEGGGLKLNLRIREMCKKFLKAHGPVIATLQINVHESRSNEARKCKELLYFMKDQVLPKTMRLVSGNRLRKIRNKDTMERRNWFRRMLCSKTKKRSVAIVIQTDRQTDRTDRQTGRKTDRQTEI